MPPRSVRPPKFRTWIGVDQTGAVLRGVPRPLAAARLTRHGTSLDLSLTRLRSCSCDDLLEFADDPHPAIALDAVLGLPAACRGLANARELWRLFAEAQSVSGYGRISSEAFFARFAVAAGEPLPRRRCELATGANSVLTTRPFQKNIQTGTFRIWKDLASTPGPWANIWPFDAYATAARAPWLFEGYPSWIWTSEFGFPHRCPERFAELLARLQTRGLLVRTSPDDLIRLQTDPDLADAAVLALGAAVLEHATRLFEPFAGFAQSSVHREGWILGAITSGNACAI